MGGYYELVIFTDEPPTYADPIINKLDPHRCDIQLSTQALRSEQTAGCSW